MTNTSHAFSKNLAWPQGSPIPLQRGRSEGQPSLLGEPPAEVNHLALVAFWVFAQLHKRPSRDPIHTSNPVTLPSTLRGDSEQPGTVRMGLRFPPVPWACQHVKVRGRQGLQEPTPIPCTGAHTTPADKCQALPCHPSV